MRTMLGVRPWRLGALPPGPEFGPYQSRVDAVYAAALLLPPSIRAPLVERATGLRAELAALQSPEPGLSLAQIAERMATLPGDVDDLEEALALAADRAYRTTGAGPGPAGRALEVAPTSLAKVGVGVGALGLLGLGIWALS